MTSPPRRVQAERLPGNPIIHLKMRGADSVLDGNVNGPSLIRTPTWLDKPLGRYHLYFGHHQGQGIRLAYSDTLAGPWQLHAPGTLRLDQTPCTGHIASPDVHVDDANRRIWMYYHGPAKELPSHEPWLASNPRPNRQRSYLAVSEDGLNFEHVAGPFGPPYARVWPWREHWYALTMPGLIFRSSDGRHDWQLGPVLFDQRMRHTAVRRLDDRLQVYYTNAGDCPERILLSEIDLTIDWIRWQTSPPVTVLEPETLWEGGSLPLEPSARGDAHHPVHQLRDPAIFQEDDRCYLLYTIAGEQGIAIAELHDTIE